MRQALLVLVALAATPAEAEQTYRCEVQDFSAFAGASEGFIRKNRLKTFMLTIGSETIGVAMKSEHYKDSTKLYRIVERREKSVTASEGNTAGSGYIVFPTAPRAMQERDGHFNAVISVTEYYFSNSWLLRCQ